MTPDPDAVLRFFRFIAARHGAHYRRNILGEGPPWTEDPIVADYFFTNVYRELDPGTEAIRAHLPAATGLSEAIFWAVAYRLAFHERTLDALLADRLLNLKEFEDRSSEMRRLLRGMDKPFTPAYVVSNYGRVGAKVDVITDILMGVARTLRNDWPGIVHIRGRQKFHGWLTANLFGVGKFVGFQAMVDLCYPRTRNPDEPDRGWLPWSNDDWIVAGPGAEKGLRIIFPYTDTVVGPTTTDALVSRLCAMQGRYLRTMSPWAMDGARVPVDRSNMQNCCCEFSKYERIRNGGSGKRRFRARDSHERDMEARGHGEQLEHPS